MVTRIDLYAWGGWALLVCGASTYSLAVALLVAGGGLWLFAGFEAYLMTRRPRQ